MLYDGQGSTRALVDGSSGNIRSSELYTYDAFGNLVSSQTNPATSYLYTGQQFDNGTGSYDLRARYYNPNDGKFISRDTNSVDIYSPNELNKYIYSNSNPTNGSDPNGRETFYEKTETQLYAQANQQNVRILGKDAVAVALKKLDARFLATEARGLKDEILDSTVPNLYIRTQCY